MKTWLTISGGIGVATLLFAGYVFSQSHSRRGPLH